MKYLEYLDWLHLLDCPTFCNEPSINIWNIRPSYRYLHVQYTVIETRGIMSYVYNSFIYTVIYREVLYPIRTHAKSPPGTSGTVPQVPQVTPSTRKP